MISYKEAIRLAESQDLDLVEVSDRVYKIMDYQKEQYHIKKIEKENKKKSPVQETSEIRIGPFIDDHDLTVKIKKIQELISDGHKVKASVRFGRSEMRRKDEGIAKLNKIIEAVAPKIIPDGSINSLGNTISVMLVKGNSK
jgi:translation initiation factor IF-3